MVEVRETANQIDDLMNEVRKRVDRNERVLVTTLTKKMSEDLSQYLLEMGFQDALPALGDRHARTHPDHPRPAAGGVRRAGRREPAARGPGPCRRSRWSAILAADKEGFLRGETSLIQTIGRAARNIEGTVLMYAGQGDAGDESGDLRDRPPP